MVPDSLQALKNPALEDEAQLMEALCVKLGM
jgi:hypothetical protein